MNVLLVDDNEDQYLVMQAAVDLAKLPLDLIWLDGAAKCLDYVHRRPPFESAKTPDLLLVDLHMPSMNGFDVLQQLKAQDTLRSIPLIIMSTSSNPSDMKRTYELGCNAYMQKPIDLGQLVEALRLLHQFWDKVAWLPSRMQPPTS